MLAVHISNPAVAWSRINDSPAVITGPGASWLLSRIPISPMDQL